MAQVNSKLKYLPSRSNYISPDEWIYQSLVVDQSYFSCREGDGHSTPTCEWAGLYEEYIVTFWTRMTPGEVTLADIEKAVRAIDERMTSYLKEATPAPNVE